MLSIGVTQDRVATPSMCTVQAPHSAAPQPNLVPVMPSTSRCTQSRGVSPSTSKLCSVPLTLMVKAMAVSELAGAEWPSVISLNLPGHPCDSRIKAFLSRFEAFSTASSRGKARAHEIFGPRQALVAAAQLNLHTAAEGAPRALTNHNPL